MDGLAKAINDHKKAVMKIYEKDLDKTIRYANAELFNEADKMYTEFIRQYYLYETKFYKRHWEFAPGTKEGQNLYFSKDISFKNKWKPYLAIYLPGEPQHNNKMYDGYQHDNPDDVLLNIYKGNRGIEDFWIEPWYGKFEGKYFKTSKSTMENAFNAFINYFEDMAQDIITKQMRKMGYN